MLVAQSFCGIVLNSLASVRPYAGNGIEARIDRHHNHNGVHDMTRATDMARRIGTDFARELNGDPREAQNWSALNEYDDLPEYDYLTLKLEFGKVTAEMAAAYKAAFNETFVGVTV